MNQNNSFFGASGGDAQESFEDYLLAQGCPDLISTLMGHHMEAYTNATAPGGGGSGSLPLPLGKDPVACLRASLEEVHKMRLGLGPRKSVEGLRSISGKRVVLCADLNPSCGVATLNARMEGLRQSLQCLVSLNAKVLLYADVGNLKEGSAVLPGRPNFTAAGPPASSGLDFGGTTSTPGRTPNTQQLRNTAPNTTPLGNNVPQSGPGARSVLASHIRSGSLPEGTLGGFPSPGPNNNNTTTTTTLPPSLQSPPAPAASAASLPVPQPVISAIKQVAAKLRMSFKMIKNLADIGRAEFTYCTNTELLFLPMLYSSGSTILTEAGEASAAHSDGGTPSGSGGADLESPGTISSAPAGESFLLSGNSISFGGTSPQPNHERRLSLGSGGGGGGLSIQDQLQMYQKQQQQLTELANPGAIAKTLCAYGEVIVLDQLDAGKFSHEAMLKVPRSIPDGLFGCFAAAEHRALAPLMTGASPRGRKRVLLLGDGVEGGAPTALRQLLSTGAGSTFEVLANMGLLFDTIILVGKTARRYHKLYMRALQMTPGNTSTLASATDAHPPAAIASSENTGGTTTTVTEVAAAGEDTQDPPQNKNSQQKVPPPASHEEGDTIATRQFLQYIKGGDAADHPRGMGSGHYSGGADDEPIGGAGTAGVSLPQVIYAEDFIAAKAFNKKRSVVPIGSGIPTAKHKWLDVGPKTTELLVNFISSGNVESLLWLGTIGEVPESTVAIIGAANSAKVPVAIAGEGPLSLIAGATMASQPVVTGFYSASLMEALVAAGAAPISSPTTSPLGPRGAVSPATASGAGGPVQSPPVPKKIDVGDQVTVLSMGIDSIASMMAAYALPALTALSPPTTNAIPQPAK